MTFLEKVISIIVAYNPDLVRFKQVLESATKQASHVIVIDNGPSNKSLIEDLCRRLNNCEFNEMGFNSGIAHALRQGIKRAEKYKATWLLFLDDDTILLDDALFKAINKIKSLREDCKDKIGAVLLSSRDSNCGVEEIKYGIFSGTLIRREIALKTCCREEFFLDQADFDMYSRIRELGYLTLVINCKLVDHKLGKKRYIPVISNISRR
jgi:rhamnosyltransferase